ncbi:uncharacterized protein SOCEGT47_024370 [Sorangium cellulosum]|uniref:Secreted protein n=1 Tax=Sorangium cellulosum TaxID=56 RepID=A0A4P2PYL0_SORCE|nr:hypothetical protein [Sorangium cellulosum]AUX21939.1 uncharacterized protein SOCEGT47_024370 [Sorangium cellulosum]
MFNPRCFKPRHIGLFIALGAGLLTAGSSGLAGSPLEAQSGGDHREGFMTLPLYRGVAVPPEATVIALPNNCERQMQATLRWSEEENWVKVKVTGKGVLVPHPSVDRTPGVNYFPNPFWPEIEDIVNGRYQFWIISQAGLLDFYYDATTKDLLGSALDFATPPPSSTTIALPTVRAIGSPFFQPNRKGDVDLEFTLAYDRTVRGDLPEYAQVVEGFPPPNLCLSDPYRIDLSTIRGYARTLPASEAVSFADYLRNGFFVSITIEPPEYYTFPPLDHLFSTYSNGTQFGGVVPRGYAWDIDATFGNVAPPIRPFAGAGQCEDFFSGVHTKGLNFCSPEGR